jgi:hypothetical protein
MEILEILLILGVGLVAGFINTVAGGGSLISLPVLIFLGLPSSVANATNRVAIFSQNVFGVAGFKSKGIGEFKYSLSLGISALFGAIAGAKLAVDIRGELFNKILAVVMIVVVFLTISGKTRPKQQIGETNTLKSRIIGLIVFFFIGIYGGFVQAGVGFLIIAALTTIHGFSLVKTNSIKMFVVLIYTIAALAVFIYEEQVNWIYGGVLAVGNSTGAWFASRWSVEKGDQAIKIFLVITVVALAIKLWLF